MAQHELHFLRALDPGYLNLILLPTEQCNFRCTYCYEDHLFGIMPRQVVQGVKRLLDKRLASLHTLNIAWFGGEPMLAMHLIEEISQHIITTRARNSLDVKYHATITTNGWRLDPNHAAKLVALGVIQAQVSLDGHHEVHDSTRKRANGQGTFDRVWGNLIQLRDSAVPLNVMIRVHLSPENYCHINELIRMLNKEFANDRRFSVLLKPIARLGGPNDKVISAFLPEDSDSAVHAIRSKLDPLLTSDTSLSDGPCYAAKPNSLVIRSDGTISKCTVAFSDDRNKIGQLHEDGTVIINQEKLQLWIRSLFSQKEAELACPLSVISGDNT